MTVNYWKIPKVKGLREVVGDGKAIILEDNNRVPDIFYCPLEALVSHPLTMIQTVKSKIQEYPEYSKAVRLLDVPIPINCPNRVTLSFKQLCL